MADVQTGKLIPYLTDMFRYQAWVAMGKVAHPMSGEIDRNLPVAREMIDLIGELEARTTGNRSADETKMIQGALTELRLNYLDESKKPESKSKPAPAEAIPDESAEASPAE